MTHANDLAVETAGQTTTGTSITCALLDILTGAELTLIMRTMRFRIHELGARRDGSLKYAAELDGEPSRQKYYQDWADEDAHEVAELTALLERLGS